MMRPHALLGCLLGLALLRLPACAQKLEEQPEQGGVNQPRYNTSEVEKAVLLEFKAAINDTKATLSNWVDTNHLCSWHGVGCDGGSHVIKLDFGRSDRSLRGTIPWDALFQLSKLQVLVLRGQFLSGPLAPVRSTIQGLDVSGNFLNGTIPAEWARLPALQELFLHNNQLTGTIPTDWSQTALKILKAGANLLEGPLPQTLPPSLTELSFEVNRLTGTIPSPLPPQLTVFKLGYNRLRGTIPPLPPQMVYLSIRDNNFTGKFPMLSDTLEICWADNNQLSGQVPPYLWGAGANLSLLSAAWNKLTGTLSPDLVLPTMHLDLSGNALSGTVPLDSWVLPATLILSNNALTGNMQDWEFRYISFDTDHSMAHCLDLSSNFLTGSIPLGFAQNTTFMFIILSNNSLTGTLPEMGSSYTNILYVDSNYLEGTLPLWPSESMAVVAAPQKGAGFCGEVPDSPTYALITVEPPPPPEEVQPPGIDAQENYYSNYVSYPINLLNIYEEYAPLDSLPECYPVSNGATGSGNGSSGDGGVSSEGGTTPVGAIAGGIVAATVAIAGKLISPDLLAEDTEPPLLNIVCIIVEPQCLCQSCCLFVVAAIVSGTLWWQRQKDRRRTAAATSRGAYMNSSSPAGLADRSSDGQSLNMESNATGTTTTSDGAGSLPRDQVLRLVIQAAETNGSINSANGASWQGGMGQGLKEWEIDFDKIQLVKQIGEGAFGRVYVALWRETKVAVKILLNPALDIYSADIQLQALTLSNPMLVNLCKEAGLMASLRHPNIVGFLGVCSMPPAVVTEFCSRGSLADILRAAKQMPSLAAKLTWQRKLRMLQHTARGMLYLHERQPPLIHRDLKSPNLLVDEHWQVKVADFNVSKLMEDAVAMSSAAVTNPRWLAPEVLSGEPATMKSDVYSYGLVMWELLTHEVPFGSENHFQLIKFITGGGRPPIPEPTKLPGNENGRQLVWLDEYIALMQQCWAQDPEERPPFQDIVRLVRNVTVQPSQRAQKLPIG